VAQDRLGSSGVFKVLVDGARKVKRAVTGGDPELPPGTLEIGQQIAQLFVSRNLDAVHALGTPMFQELHPRKEFVPRWRHAIEDKGPLTSFEVSNIGHIELGFIPGLEEVPQEQFVAFLELAFSTPTVPLDDDKAFVVGIVLLDNAGKTQVGAIHIR
jgi:hypothetical protein